MKKKRNKILCTLLLICMIAGILPERAAAASFQYKYNGKTVTYSGIQPTVKYNDKKISLSKTPGILVNDIALVPYYEVFVKNGPKVKKSYNSSTKELVITYNQTTIKMTVNKKTAYVNETKVTLPVAPRRVTYKNSNLTRILVPSRKVSEYLGLEYEWDSKSRVVSIQGPGSSDATSAVKTATYYRNGIKKTAKICQMNWGNTKIDISSTPAITIDNVNMVPYYYALTKNGPKVKRSYKSASKTLKLTYNGNILTMNIGNKYADLNGERVALSAAPVLIKYTKTGSNCVLVPIKSVATYLGMSYQYSSSNRTISLNQGLSIKYDGSYKVYSDTQKQIFIKNMPVTTDIPSIKIENVWYIPAKTVCSGQYELGVTYSYQAQKAYFTDGINDVEMTANTAEAVINGTAKTMPAKVRIVRLTKKKTNYVMIPVEYFCSLFGLGYSNSTDSISLQPANKIYPSGIPQINHTKYSTDLTNYAKTEYDLLSDSYKKSLSLADFTKYISTENDTTQNYKYLRLDTYREMKVAELNQLIASNSKGKTGVLKGQAEAINNAAKTYKIDPVAFAMQCIHETGWGTSTLAKGITSDTVAIPIYNSKKEITGFEKDSKGNYKTTKLTKAVTAYNLFGIKAYDSAANLCAFTYAYYNGWTTIPAAIAGGAKYISENYIHNATYKQNTFYKFRFNPNTNYLWHQYATDPGYAEKVGTYLKNYDYLYGTTATFQYDYPQFAQE